MLINSPILWPRQENFFFFAAIPHADGAGNGRLWLMKSDASANTQPIAAAATSKLCFIPENNSLIFEKHSPEGADIWEYSLEGGGLSQVTDQTTAGQVLADCVRGIGPGWVALKEIDRPQVVRTKTFQSLAIRLNTEGKRNWITVFNGTPATRHEVHVDWATSFGMPLYPEQIGIEYGFGREIILYPDLLPGERKKIWADGMLKILKIDPIGQFSWLNVPFIEGIDEDILRIVPLSGDEMLVAVDVYRDGGPHGLWRVRNKQAELLSSDSVVASTVVVRPDGCAVAYAIRETSDRGQRIVNTPLAVRRIC